MTDPADGGAYFVLSLSDGRFLLGRREPAGEGFYWLLVSSACSLESGMFATQSGIERLSEEHARAEQLRIVAFFRSRTSRADAIMNAPDLAVCINRR